MEKTDEIKLKAEVYEVGDYHDEPCVVLRFETPNGTLTTRLPVNTMANARELGRHVYTDIDVTLTLPATTLVKGG